MPAPQTAAQFKSKKPLRLVLDEPVLYIEDKPAMVRGEVIVHFAHETTIQGPIELVFEAIQIFYPWPEIMTDRTIGKPKESRLQMIELSLLPPNSQGIMPAGVHRFPFEFPIPPSLPPTISITNRISIFYRLTATLKKAFDNASFVDWARQSVSRKKLVDVSHLRLVRAVNSSSSLPPSAPPTATSSSAASVMSSTRSSIFLPADAPSESSSSSSPPTSPIRDLWAQYNDRATMDEQHDRLIYQSMGGRVCDNFNRPLTDLVREKGVRYRLTVDRTAIALGTSLGLEVILQPTQKETRIRSIYVTLSEHRKYNIALPSKDGMGERCQTTEKNKTLLKWAYAYPILPTCLDPDYDKELPDMAGSYDAKKNITHLGNDYQHNIDQCKTLWDLDQPFSALSNDIDQQENQQHAQLPGKDASFSDGMVTKIRSMAPRRRRDAKGTMAPNGDALHTKDNLLNIKQLDHAIPLGKFFKGYFVLPVPPCGGMLHASMDDETITIQHWLRMVVELEQDGKHFELSIESPIHILDCRLVSDDEKQTILPPPPSYNDDNRAISSDVFWHQRQPITTTKQWGTCRRPCPCQIKAYRQKQHTEKTPAVDVELGPPPIYTP
ncbi:hypothetical protein BC940DRAFT_301327 [Gongronella butleri]|nr:hypothetical protein BC940DRAFT_301327 [Gongronella butleri]